MGYTNYWKRTNKPITEDFIEAVNDIIKESENLGIHLGDGMGEGNPIVGKGGVYLNGDINKDGDYESFYIENEASNFEFCKTARRPYDYTVKQILMEAEACGIIEDFSCDGSIIFTNDAGKCIGFYDDKGITLTEGINYIYGPSGEIIPEQRPEEEQELEKEEEVPALEYREMEIYFSDLNEEAQERLLEIAGVNSPEEANWNIDPNKDTFPITTIGFEAELNQDEQEYDDDLER